MGACLPGPAPAACMGAVRRARPGCVTLIARAAASATWASDMAPQIRFPVQGRGRREHQRVNAPVRRRPALLGRRRRRRQRRLRHSIPTLSAGFLAARKIAIRMFPNAGAAQRTRAAWQAHPRVPGSRSPPECECCCCRQYKGVTGAVAGGGGGSRIANNAPSSTALKAAAASGRGAAAAQPHQRFSSVTVIRMWITNHLIAPRTNGRPSRAATEGSRRPPHLAPVHRTQLLGFQANPQPTMDFQPGEGLVVMPRQRGAAWLGGGLPSWPRRAVASLTASGLWSGTR